MKARTQINLGSDDGFQLPFDKLLTYARWMPAGHLRTSSDGGE
ncbi:MAG: hypothetical protein V4719_18235 [Planctomycetota bacterium]